MGILDSVIGSLLGGNQNQAGGSSPLGGIISSVLGGGQGGQQAGAPAAGGGLAGGLGGLLSQFDQAGLGDVARSWVGNGANAPVSPDQLQSVFGQDQTRAMADKAGMDHGDFLDQLSQHLPRAVDGMTGGSGSEEGSMNV